MNASSLTDELIAFAEKHNIEASEIQETLAKYDGDIVAVLDEKLGAFLHDLEATSLLRKLLLSPSWEYREYAASMVIYLKYDDDAHRALIDDSSEVRYSAVRQLECQNDVTALIEALQNESARVRSVAAWHMGRKKVSDSLDPLIALLKVENDIEVLRASIWSLGVLRDVRAKSALEGFLHHQNSLIVSTTRDTLSKFSAT